MVTAPYVVFLGSYSMTATASFRPYLLALGGNLLFFLWAWLGVNDGKGLFFFTTDELGLMLLLPLVAAGNVGLYLGAALANRDAGMKAFGLALLLLLGGCTATWVHGCATGVTA